MNSSVLIAAVFSLILDMLNATYRYFCIIGLLLMTIACTEEDPMGTPPRLLLVKDATTINSDTAVAPGQLMHFIVSGAAGEYPMTEFLIRVVADSTQIYYDTGMYVDHFEWKGSFAKSFNDNETWEFVVRDRYSQSDMVSIMIGNDSVPGFGPVVSLTDIVLGAQNNAAEGGFFSLIDQLKYFAEDAIDVQEKIELIYYYYNEDENTIASPGANIEDGVFPEGLSPVDWDFRNTTRYIKTGLTSDDFEGVNNDSILIVSYVEGEGKRKAKNLLPGDIYSFKTQGSKFGLFRVNKVDGTLSGTIDIDIKIQN